MVPGRVNDARVLDFSSIDEILKIFLRKSQNRKNSDPTKWAKTRNLETPEVNIWKKQYHFYQNVFSIFQSISFLNILIILKISLLQFTEVWKQSHLNQNDDNCIF